MMTRKQLWLSCTAFSMLLTAGPRAARAQWSTTYEQFYFPGGFNWEFRQQYPAADRLFNAFDYGHAILYEKLWTQPRAPVSNLEEDEFNFITRRLLVNPPNLPLEEGAIEIAYARIAPEAKMMFEWAHLLHRQIYDVWADERLSATEKDAQVHSLLRYYRTRKDLAFSSVPKSMELMEGQPYSLAFRKKYPKFNGLIWAYHWLQVGLYEPLLAGKNKDERQTGVLAAVARFRQMIEQPPTWMPRVMPMTPAVAPLFTARYPEAAIIFDNLHSMHDVISDVLANSSVPRARKRAEILKAAQRYRDDTSFVMSRPEWLQMAAAMGVENMGGPARGFLAAFPAPTVERGAVMTHAGMNHSTMTTPADSTKGVDHSTMHHATAAAPPPREGQRPQSSDVDALHARMMADPVIMARVNADPAMKRLMQNVMSGTSGKSARVAPAAGRSSTRKPAARTPPTRAKSSLSRKAAPRKSTTVARKPPPPPVAAKAKPKAPPDPHAGMDHSKMKTPPRK